MGDALKVLLGVTLAASLTGNLIQWHRHRTLKSTQDSGGNTSLLIRAGGCAMSEKQLSEHAAALISRLVDINFEFIKGTGHWPSLKEITPPNLELIRDCGRQAEKHAEALIAEWEQVVQQRDATQDLRSPERGRHPTGQWTTVQPRGRAVTPSEVGLTVTIGITAVVALLVSGARVDRRNRTRLNNWKGRRK